MRILVTVLMIATIGCSYVFSPAGANAATLKKETDWREWVRIQQMQAQQAPAPNLLDELEKKLTVRATDGFSQEEIERLQAIDLDPTIAISVYADCMVYKSLAERLVKSDPEQALRWLERYQKCLRRAYRDTLKRQKELEEGKQTSTTPSFPLLLVVLFCGGVSCLSLVGIFIIQLKRLRLERRADLEKGQNK